MAEYNVVFLIRNTVGGMQKHLIDTVINLDRKRYEISIIAPDCRPYKKAVGKRARFYEVPIEDNISPIKDMGSIYRLAKLLKTLQPDILHIHSNKAALVGRIAAKLSGVRHIIVTVHNFLIYQEKGPVMRRLASLVERTLTRFTCRIITVSDELKRSLVDIEGIPDSKVITIHNGIDLDEWKDVVIDKDFRKKKGVSDDALLIGTVGRFVPFKAQDVLIDATQSLVKEHPNLRVIIAGKGPLEQELKSQVNELGLTNIIIFPGYVDDIKSMIKALDIFILPSRKEPFGIVLLEAMAAETPIVGVAAGGVPEIIEDRRNGLLAPPDSYKDLADRIRELAKDPDLGKQMAKQALQDLQTKFSIKQMVRQVEKTYSKCLDSM